MIVLLRCVARSRASSDSLAQLFANGSTGGLFTRESLESLARSATATATTTRANLLVRKFSAAGISNLDNVDAATLRAEAASALAESDDDGLNDFGGPSFA